MRKEIQPCLMECSLQLTQLKLDPPYLFLAPLPEIIKSKTNLIWIYVMDFKPTFLVTAPHVGRLTY